MPAGLAMPCSQHSGLHIMHVMPGCAVGCTPCTSCLGMPWVAHHARHAWVCRALDQDQESFAACTTVY